MFLIDTDPQGSLTAWHIKRELEVPQRVEIPFDRLRKALKLLKGHSVLHYRHGFRPDRHRQGPLKLANCVIFPVQAREDDLTAAPVTVPSVEAIDVPFLFVLTRVKANTLITAQAAAVLSKHGEVVETLVNDRTVYKAPYARGRTEDSRER